MYKYLPLDWLNWNPAKCKMSDFIPKPDPYTPPTHEDKRNDAISALIEYDVWKSDIPTKYIALAKELHPDKASSAIKLEERAKTVENCDLRRIVLTEAASVWADLLDINAPVI